MLTVASKNGLQRLKISECIYEYSLPDDFINGEGNSGHFPKKGIFTFLTKDFILFDLILRSLLLLESIF